MSRISALALSALLTTSPPVGGGAATFSNGTGLPSTQIGYGSPTNQLAGDVNFTRVVGTLSTGQVLIMNSTPANSTTTGALVVGTGAATSVSMGGGNLYVGNTLTVGATATFNATLVCKGGFTFDDSATNSKQINIVNTAASASTLLTLAGNQSTTQILNFPNITATDTLATLGLAQTFTAVKTFTAGITVGTAATLVTSNVAMNNGAGSGAGTLTNAPAAGNPTKWIPINDAGTTRYFPAW